MALDEHQSTSRRPSRSASGSSSASPATPATACSSPAAASRTRPPLFGNDLATLPDFPAEIRAPAGTVGGVSAFQIHFAARDILTPGDTPNVLVAMNPAALKANVATLQRGATIIVNEDAFTRPRAAEGRLRRRQPARGRLAGGLRRQARPDDLARRSAPSRAWRASPSRDAQKAKNLFALGLLSWLYDRPTEVTERWIETKFGGKPHVMDANLAAYRAGWSFGETSELIGTPDPRRARPPTSSPAPTATSTARRRPRSAWSPRPCSPGLPLLLGAYPITPASELLHELSRHHALGVRTIQAEDEIAAASIALGAAFGGALGVTATSRPGPGPQDGDDRPGRDAGAADDRHRRPARRPVDRACRPRPSSRTCCRRSTAATASRRCR